MILKIDGETLAASPSQFEVIPLDLDNGETTIRTTDGTLHRDRIATKRQINMSWGLLSWEEISSILQAMSGVFFDFYYPDPMTGKYETKTFYVGNRPATVAVSTPQGLKWSGLKVTLTER
ncbi:DUF6711 family protein [Lutispora sp.]|uniref:DUF6711 family protein n=1 Tax=Lutispora sp. TaxID=2828727 RepID=UPI002B206C25|nr:DUF6711 family protein [Lutispora sp.]MEA4961136.1 DUF6711 family protein [Lutispora sp.]